MATVGSIQVADALLALEAMGANAASLRNRAGIPGAVLDDAANRLPAEAAVRLFDLAADDLHEFGSARIDLADACAPACTSARADRWSFSCWPDRTPGTRCGRTLGSRGSRSIPSRSASSSGRTTPS